MRQPRQLEKLLRKNKQPFNLYLKKSVLQTVLTNSVIWHRGERRMILKGNCIEFNRLPCSRIKVDEIYSDDKRKLCHLGAVVCRKICKTFKELQVVLNGYF